MHDAEEPDDLRARFEIAWRAAAPSLARLCRLWTTSPADADDLFQHVAIRCWRGFPGFRGDAGFRTWAIRIAEHEAARQGRRLARQRRHEQGLDGDEPGPPAEPAGPAGTGPPDPGQLRAAVTAAYRAGVLGDAERHVLIQRLDHPDDTWDRIGERLALTGTACAVAHSRGVPKLRVHLFTSAPALLGGPTAVRTAFGRAAADRSQPLSPAEREVFQRVILAGDTRFRPRGWQLHLRAACGKVARYLDR
jgi:RNA polymerase sigma factor (sigma-70 family)